MITKNPTSRALIIHSVVRFDALHVEHHRQQLRVLVEEGYRHLIFDLEHTEYINSSGLGMLVEFHNSVARGGGSFGLLNVRPEILWLLHQTHLDHLLPVAGDPSDASARAGGAPAGDAAPGRHQDAMPGYDALHAIMSDEILILTRVTLLTERILQLSEPVAIGKAMLDGLAEALNSRRGALFLLTHRQERLELAHWIDATDHPIQPPATDFPLKFGKIEHQVIERGKACMFELSDDDDNPARAMLHGLGFRRFMVAPILGALRPYGLLCIEIDDDPARLHVVQPLVQAMTQIGGLAMEKTALLEQVTLQKDELNDAIERLRHSRNALRDASHLAAIGSLLTGLGHQLNNKLAPVIGYLQMLMGQDDLSDDAKKKMAAISVAAVEIHEIAQKMAHVSGLRSMRNVPMDPLEVLRVALTLFDPLIQQKHIALRLSGLDGAIGRVQGDSDLFLQAMIAILHRSITSFAASHPAPRVTISASQSDDAFELVVEDNGQALLPVDVGESSDPFLPFEQLEEGSMSSYSIPRGILHRLKGSMDLFPLPDGGKRVLLQLPLT
jgi:anti-anti-sigma factor